MRPCRTMTALTFAICTLGAQAAQAIERPGTQAPARQDGARPAHAMMQVPEVPTGALVFAAVGAVFLFRGRRAGPTPERD
jgi:hypothetical protein